LGEKLKTSQSRHILVSSRWFKKLFGILTVFLALFLILGICSTKHIAASTGINADLSFEGKIVNSSSGINIPDGTYNMEFKIYNAATACTPSTGSGCTLAWTEDWLVGSSEGGIALSSGTYQVNLGATCPFSGGSCTPAESWNTNTAINWNTYPLYLSLQIGNTSSCTITTNFTSNCGGDGEMKPYIMLTSTPYAENANNSNQLGGLASSSFAQLAIANSFQPTTNVTGVTVLQTSAASPNADIFDVQTYNNTNAIQVTGGAVNVASVNLTAVGSGASINITANTASSNINIGSSTVANNINIGTGTGNSAIQIGSITATTGAQTIAIGNNALGAVVTTNIGATNNAATTTNIYGGVNGATPTIYLSDYAAGVITIGNTGSANTVNIGTGTAASTINVGTGTGNSAIQIGSITATTGAQTIAIGNNALGAVVTTTVGSNSSTSTTTINGGVNSTTPTIQLAAAASGYIQIGSTTASTANTIQIGGVTVNSDTVNINTFATGTETTNIGSTNSTSTTSIYGGVNSTTDTLYLAAAGSGYIGIGSTSVVNTINIGTIGTATNADTVNIDNTIGSASEVVSIGSKSSVSSLVLQAGSGNLQINNEGYVLNFPTATPSTSQCLQTGASTYSTMVFATCGGSGSTHPKKIVLAPEYANAVLWNNNNTTTDIGTMTSGFTATGVGSLPENYYSWTTAQSTNQAYAIVVQIPIPSDFNTSNTITSITIDTYTTNTTNGTITAKLYGTNGTIESNWNTCNLTPSSATTWTTITATTTCTTSGTYAPNGTATLVLILQAPSGGTTDVGNIVLSYTSAY
jgi:hypothetical protein